MIVNMYHHQYSIIVMKSLLMLKLICLRLHLNVMVAIQSMLPILNDHEVLLIFIISLNIQSHYHSFMHMQIFMNLGSIQQALPNYLLLSISLVSVYKYPIIWLSHHLNLMLDVYNLDWNLMKVQPMYGHTYYLMLLWLVSL